MALVAFGHKARSGKDTAAEILVAKGYKLFRFSAPVYMILYAIQTICNGIILNEASDEALNSIKAQIIAKVCEIINSVHISDIARAISVIISDILHRAEEPGAPETKVPWLLQSIGQTFRAEIGDSVWVDIVEDQIVAEQAAALVQAREPCIVIPDVRFVNETEMLREKGFVIIQIHRPIGRPIDRDPNHVTETALDNFDYDHVIQNTGPLCDFIKSVNDTAASLSW